ncbi:hypothetical protein D3C86_756390 [compost metagenome]
MRRDDADAADAARAADHDLVGHRGDGIPGRIGALGRKGSHGLLASEREHLVHQVEIASDLAARGVHDERNAAHSVVGHAALECTLDVLVARGVPEKLEAEAVQQHAAHRDRQDAILDVVGAVCRAPVVRGEPEAVVVGRGLLGHELGADLAGGKGLDQMTEFLGALGGGQDGRHGKAGGDRIRHQCCPPSRRPSRLWPGVLGAIRSQR